MANYGHPLQFGVQINRPRWPKNAVEVAARAEDLGLDVVLLDDRLAPDDPGSAADSEGDSVTEGSDLWTLASWAAGRTSRITIAAAGLHPGSRPPSVLARSAASLALLTGGRVALGFGADESAIEPSIPALTDAIAVVRAMWDTTTEEVTHPGLHHSVVGAQPGPATDREIPLWLSGSDPALASLAGAAADAVVVDLAHAGGEPGLAHLNTTIDEAAASHDRDPREIRRLVIVPAPSSAMTDAQDWVDRLAPLVVEHGVSAILLRVEDRGADSGEHAGERLDHFAEQVAPAVRDEVDRRLPQGLRHRRFRRPAVRARRHPGVDYEAVPDSLIETAVEPGDPAYPRLKSNYLRGGRPALVLRPGSVDEVVDAVSYAREHPHLDLGVRSGGHGISGRSTNDGGLVIDLGRLNTIEVLEEDTRLVRLGPGARWRDVATALQPRGWAITSGDYGGVGVGGLITAGGIGFLSRNHGLTIDKLRAAELVLADGTVLRASEHQNPEVFWAVRGAGANFGILTGVELTADPVELVGWAQLAYQVDDPAQFLVDFGQAATKAPRETTAFLTMGPTRGGRGTAQVMAMVDAADPEAIVGQLQPFAQLATLADQQVVIAPYAAVMNMFPDQPHQARSEPVSRSGLLNELTPQFAAAATDLLASGAVHWFQLRTLGEATSDVPAQATAFAHRDAVVQVTAMGANAQRVDRYWDDVRPHFDGLYLSFETDRSPERLSEAFGAQSLHRLRRLKAELDPDQLFQDNFAIEPAHEARSDQ